MSTVSPEILDALQKFGLITEGQANEEFARWEKEWDAAWAEAHWWHDLSKIAWSLQPWRKRLFGFSVSWKFAWIKEQRGW